MLTVQGVPRTTMLTVLEVPRTTTASNRAVLNRCCLPTAVVCCTPVAGYSSRWQLAESTTETQTYVNNQLQREFEAGMALDKASGQLLHWQRTLHARLRLHQAMKPLLRWPLRLVLVRITGVWQCTPLMHAVNRRCSQLSTQHSAAAGPAWLHSLQLPDQMAACAKHTAVSSH
jgi:hypothetical protein